MTLRPTPDRLHQFFAPPQRKRIRPEEMLPLDLDDRERELILQHTFAGEDLTRRLRVVSRGGKPATCRYTLGELDDLAGHVAAAANHAKDKRLKKHLSSLFGRIEMVLASYTDEDD